MAAREAAHSAAPAFGPCLMSGGILRPRRNRTEALVAAACVVALCCAALHRAVSLLDEGHSVGVSSHISHEHTYALGITASAMPLPITFGPASAPLALAVRRHLKHLVTDASEFDAVWESAGASSDFSSASAAFLSTVSSMLLRSNVCSSPLQVSTSGQMHCLCCCAGSCTRPCVDSCTRHCVGSCTCPNVGSGQ
jgi:hypothetical protein